MRLLRLPAWARAALGPALPAAALALGLTLAAGPGTPAAATPSPAPVQPVKPSILVETGRIDASVLLPADGNPALREELARIPLGVILDPLGQLVLLKADLETRLGPLATLLAIPQRVQIRRRGDLLSGQEVAASLVERCRQAFADDPTPPAPDDLVIDVSRLPRSFVLPGPVESVTLEPMSNNRLGLRLFTLHVQCRGGQVRQIVQADVARRVRAARMKRLARRGEVLTAADLAEETVLQRSDQAQPPLGLDQAVGKCLATYKSPGTFLREGDVSLEACSLAEPAATPAGRSSAGVPARPGRRPQASREEMAAWVVRPGEQVEFFVKSGGLSLKVPAKALEGGGLGSSIKLINLQNNRQITGTITAEGKVEYGVN
ncbi:MAG: flagella basal body P-ring formation protein FlgA [Candidatus Riflebacteria bacterium]|nr:flagella basal body P-ring formation protein FlgA [Candidatus Riflebacteria bacterium]